MIEIKDLTVGYKGVVVLDGVSLNVSAGEIMALMGGSGCGKSTLLRAVMRLIPVSAGEIHIDGQRTDNLTEAKMNEVRKSMGMVFQEGALFDSMSVRDNVAFALRRHTRMKEREVRETARERLDAVGLSEAEEKMPSELSGGMRRRVGIARALALSPKILLYDEPTAGLDPLLTATVVELILKMRDRYGATSLVVTHDIAAAEMMSDRVAMIHEGRLILQGAFTDLAKSGHPHVRGFFNSMKVPSEGQGGN